MNKEITKRYILFIIGLFINAVGICLIIKADLGSSPISSLPYTLSLKYPVSLGTLTTFLNILLIIGQKLMPRKEFRKRELLQLPVSLIFGIFVDLCMIIFATLSPQLYISKLILLTLGCAILGLGVSIEVMADVVMLSGEAFVKAIAMKSGKEFGIIKVFFDSTLMILACVTSIILFLGGIVGVREGTVIAALTVGIFARFFNKRLAFIGNYLCN